jgi:ComF family protein
MDLILINIKLRILSYTLLMSLLDLLFPKTCIYCQRAGKYICIECESIFFESYGEFSLPNENSPPIHICFRYNNAIEQALTLTKHEGYYRIGVSLGKLMAKSIKRHGIISKSSSSNISFIPVPISAEKKRRRGFNQVDYLIDGILKEHDIQDWQVSKILERVKDTETQIGLNKSQREKNLSNSFAVNNNFISTHKNHNNQKNNRSQTEYILVDDVYTTGTTVEYCLKVLENSEIIPKLIVIFAKG